MVLADLIPVVFFWFSAILRDNAFTARCSCWAPESAFPLPGTVKVLRKLMSPSLPVKPLAPVSSKCTSGCPPDSCFCCPLCWQAATGLPPGRHPFRLNLLPLLCFFAPVCLGMALMMVSTPAPELRRSQGQLAGTRGQRGGAAPPFSGAGAPPLTPPEGAVCP